MPVADETVQSIRSRICDRILVVVSILAIPALYASLSRAPQFGWHLAMSVHLAIVAAIWGITLFRRRLPFNVRAGSLCALGFLMGFAGIWSFGLMGGAIVWLVVAPVVATAFFGWRLGVIGLGLSVAILGGAGVYFILTVGLPDVNVGSYMVSSGGWINVITAVIAAGGVTLAVTGTLVQSLLSALRMAQKRGDALEKSGRTYRQLINSMPQTVYSHSSARGHFYFSPRVEWAFGCSPAGLTSRPEAWLERVHPDDRGRLEEALAAGHRGEGYNLQYRVKDSSGNWRWSHDRGIACRRDADETIVDGILTDVTDERAREAQLQQAQKMEAVGQLTGGIAHDFNNLLTVLQGNLELLSEHATLPRDQRAEQADMERSFIATALNSCARGAQLTHRLLAFSRRQTLVPEVLDPRRLIDGLMDMMQRTIGATIDIDVKYDDGLWHCEVDPAQLESAVLNLAINARDAMAGGGKLTISLRNAHLDDEYAAAAEEVMPGQYVLISVHDTGMGIEPDLLTRVFEPFFTTKEVGSGSGLGLSMVYGFAKQSNGHVSIYSEVGHGTTVKLYLPRTRTQQAAVQEVSLRNEPRARGETILVVEDETDVRTLVVALLSELGYTIIEAKDGAGALARLHGSPHIDLLLTDIVLPGGMGGPSLAKRLRRQYPDLRILFMSGFAPDILLKHGRLEEGMELINKPFRRADLARRVRAVLAQTPPDDQA